MTVDAAHLTTSAERDPAERDEYRSPFASNALLLTAEAAVGEEGYLSEFVSPFQESVQFETDRELEYQAIEALVGDFEDGEFTEALEALTQEASARHSAATAEWAGEAMAPELASTEVEQWLEAIAGEADHRLAQLADRFGDRTMESLGAIDLEAFEDREAGEALSPLDAQEDFLKKLVRKVGRMARGVVKLAKKGLSAVGRLLPIGKLLGAVRKLIRPLLRRVLGVALSRLPAALQPAARKLAQRFGLEAESGEQEHAGAVGERLASEFDSRLASQLLAADQLAADQEIAEYESVVSETELADPVAVLDAGRRTLGEFFESAEHQADPTAAMEQFVPAVLPLIKLGITIVGREKVVKLVAGLIGKLIRPMVGGALAPALSQAIAGSGLSLIGLEAEAPGAPSIGAEALVSVTEDTVRQVFAANREVLGNELLTAAVVHEAFSDAVSRHLPAKVLRAGVLDDEPDRGVWVMMPRRSRGRYRYRRYDRPVRFVVTRPAARAIIFPEGESLEDRMLEAGLESFPAEAEVEAYELLPGGQLGHLVGGEFDPRSSNVAELSSEYEELDEASGLNLLLPDQVAPGTVHRGAGRRPRRFVRIRVQGRPLRRRSVLSLRWHLDEGKPVLAVALRLGERRALDVAGQLEGRQQLAVVKGFQRWVRGPLRNVLARRLVRLLTRHGVGVGGPQGPVVAERVADAIAVAFAGQLTTIAPQLAAAAKDPRRGVTIVFRLAFASRNAVATSAPTVTKVEVFAGWRHG